MAMIARRRFTPGGFMEMRNPDAGPGEVRSMTQTGGMRTYGFQPSTMFSPDPLDDTQGDQWGHQVPRFRVEQSGGSVKDIREGLKREEWAVDVPDGFMASRRQPEWLAGLERGMSGIPNQMSQALSPEQRQLMADAKVRGGGSIEKRERRFNAKQFMDFRRDEAAADRELTAYGMEQKAAGDQATRNEEPKFFKDDDGNTVGFYYRGQMRTLNGDDEDLKPLKIGDEVVGFMGRDGKPYYRPEAKKENSAEDPWGLLTKDKPKT